MSIPNDLLAEAVAGLLARIPEKWEPVPSALAEHERQALEALIAAGLIERKITFTVRLPGQAEQAVISVEATGEAGFAEAMEAACQDLWQRWGKRWAELHGEVGRPKHIVETREDYWRLSSEGKIAKADLLSGSEEDRQRVVDFVLRRGFFDGTPKLLPDGRIVRREPVRGSGRLLRCQIENAPSGPLGVEVGNWQAGAEAFAREFERLFQTLGSSLAAAPSPASGQAAPAASKPKRGAKKTKEVTDSEHLIISALAKHHRYGQEDINQQPVKVRELAKTLTLSPSVVSDFFKKKFGGYKNYVVLCRSRDRLIASLKLLQGEYTPRFLLSKDPEQQQNEDSEQQQDKEE